MNVRIVTLLAFSLTAAMPAVSQTQEQAKVEVELSRVREGGAPADDPQQRLTPFALDLTAATPGDFGVPTSGLIASPPEYDPVGGVLFRYTSGYGNVVANTVAALTGNPAHDDIAYVVVSSASNQASAAAAFTAAGANLSKVVFYIEPTDSVWLRDYGPHFVWQDGALAIVDSHYYPTRPQDNFIPTLLAEDGMRVPPYAMGLYYSGGNFQPGPGRSGFVTSLIQQDNAGFSTAYLGSLYRDFQGIDTLHIMPRLPSSVDGTGHIDMWMYLVDEDSVIISQFLPGSNATAIQVTNDAVPYMQALGFTVTRVPAWNVGSTHFTYTNAFRVNNRIFVPIYGPGNASYLDEDAQAMAAWAASAGPGVEIVPINCWSIIPSAGAIHCIVMQVPKRTAPLPAAHVVTPDGGELLVAGTTEELVWSATDDVSISSVDIDCSTDGGVSFPWPVATSEHNDGRFSWAVPGWLSTDAIMRVTARDGAGNSVAAFSATALEISNDPQSVYDFSTGAGTDKWAWGDRTQTWASLNGQQHPAAVSTPIDVLKPGAYAKIAASDATGADTDANRYISAVPTSGWETSHVFEFTVGENRAALRDVAVSWEGYGDDCIQMELYVWDRVAHNWGDGLGNVGENAYVTTFAGNRDNALVGHLRADFERVLDFDGTLTFLLYGERSGQESFHDAVKVTVTYADVPAGHWADLGLGLAGALGKPALEGSGLLSGDSPVSLGLQGAAVHASTVLVLGLSRVDAPFKGGVLVPAPDYLVPGLVTDANGALQLAAAWPAGVPAGTALHLQAWIGDASAPQGWAASNAIRATAP